MNRFTLMVVVFFFCMSISGTLFFAKQAIGATAEENFQWYCAQCHDQDGTGRGINATKFTGTPRNFTDPKKMTKITDEQIFNVITGGGPANTVSSGMPPWGNVLTSDEIKNLIKYIRTFCKC